MEKKIIITIGRQYGSGGRYVGKKLAEQLGIAFYDKELINLASKESGICGEFFEKADERNSGSLLKALAMGFSMNNAIFQSNDYLSNESLFQIQSDVIRKVAAEQSGRVYRLSRTDDLHRQRAEKRRLPLQPGFAS